jgi:cysteinyl-tRNA synthetase
MAEKLLGDTFDIHGGGTDLIFPHHENEIAQSVCAHGGKALANYWMHNGMLELTGEKMAKSVGNVVTAHGLLEQWPGEVLRLQMLMTHYRHPIDWTEAGSREARTVLDRWYAVAADVEPSLKVPNGVLAALEDDLNTPAAFAELHKLAGAAGAGSNSAARDLKASGLLLGLFSHSLTEWRRWTPKGKELDAAQVEDLIAKRVAARKAKNFAEADRLRAELTAMGIAIEDGPGGTTWKVMS